MSNIPEDSSIIYIPETQEVIEDNELKTSEISVTKQHDQENKKAQNNEELIVNCNVETQVEIKQLNEDGVDDCHEPKTSVDTLESQPEIQHMEAENEGTKKAKDKEEVEEADNNQSCKGKVFECTGAINDHAVGDAEGVVQVCNDENSKIIFGDTLLKYLDKIKAKADKEQLKWNGDLQQLKDFITLILNLHETWKKASTKILFTKLMGN